MEDRHSDAFALYPLTLCDIMQERMRIGNGWVVHGVVEVEKVREALDRVVDKWRMLAGRVEVKGKKSYIRIPLGRLPPSYKAYHLTSEDSLVPLSHYTPLPIPSFSKVLPDHFFVSKELPSRLGIRDSKHAIYAWADSPLTHWHITRFTQKGEEFTCIGMVYPHGVFDGLSSAFIVHALEAELAGREWRVPPPALKDMRPGILENPLDTLMEEELERRKGEDPPGVHPIDYFPAMSIVGLVGLLLYALQSIWVRLVHGHGHWSVVLPYQVHRKMVERARKECENAGLVGAQVGTDEVVFCWLMKALHSGGGEDPSKTVAFYSQATMRTEWDGALELYPHNCNIGQALPTFTVYELTNAPLYQLAYKMAKGRRESSRRQDATRFWKMWAEARARFNGYLKPQGVAGETMTLTNLSMARTGEIDLSSAGGGKTVANYLFCKLLSGNPLEFSIMNGRLSNGDLALTFYATTRRARAVERELQSLLEEYA